MLYNTVQRFSLTLTLRCSGQELASDSAGEPLFLPGEAVPLHDPGLRDTLCAFSPQRHGYTMKSLNPGLVGIRDSAALGFNGSRFDHGHQNSFRRVVTKYRLMFAVSHRK